MHALFFFLGLNIVFSAEIVKVTELPLELPKIAAKDFNRDSIALGEKLFFDVKLSGSGQRSCATCHIPSHSFASSLDIDHGDAEVGTRNTPILINRYFSTKQMWDGRAASLQDQIWMPIQSNSEMGNTPKSVLRYLNSKADYTKLFKQVFGENANEKNVAQALAQFVSSNFAAGSRYDEYVHGNKRALSAEEKRGLALFQDKFKCVSCHVGFNFTNEKLAERCGREEYYNKDDSYIRKYKVPTLRNLEDTAPYFHNGKLPTIASVIEFYQGCQVVDSEGKMIKGQIIQMTAKEKKELEKFLRSLKSKIYQYRP